MSGVRDLSELRKLTLPERLKLVGDLWDSILEDPGHLPVPDELTCELQARLAAHQADPRTSESWASVERTVFGDD